MSRSQRLGQRDVGVETVKNRSDFMFFFLMGKTTKNGLKPPSPALRSLNEFR